jgi:hypothetical protein
MVKKLFARLSSLTGSAATIYVLVFAGPCDSERFGFDNGRSFLSGSREQVTLGHGIGCDARAHRHLLI